MPPLLGYLKLMYTFDNSYNPSGFLQWYYLQINF